MSILIRKESISLTTFETLGLADNLLRAVREEGYETATPIQLQAIPAVLGGRDLMGCAQTGTGKTAAFALPTLQRLATSVSPAIATIAARHSANGHAAPRNGKRNSRYRDSFPMADRRPIRTLVLAPTRELAAQIGDSFKTYGRYTGLRLAVVYGGVGQGPQVRALQNGVDILVATPGRLLDLMEQGHINLGHVEILILDEADQMLDMGFIVPLRRIVAAVPKGRQTLMFSATMPPAIRKLSSEWLRDPAFVEVAPVATPAELVAQSVYFVEARQKPQLLTHFLQNTAFTRTLVFARTKHGADKIVRNLVRSGIRALAIHGNKSQNARQRTLDAFKSDRPPVLVATDVAARGLDVDAISHVINYDLPDVPEVYVHRIGRTGRAGATGTATSFCGRDERTLLREIERLIRRAIAIEQDHPEYPRDTRPAASNDERRTYANGTRPRRPNGGNRSQQGGAPTSRQPAPQGQFRHASQGSGGGNGSAGRRRRRPGGARRRAL
jgi:ATP-dependent RNA helicase RhlE